MTTMVIWVAGSFVVGAVFGSFAKTGAKRERRSKPRDVDPPQQKR